MATTKKSNPRPFAILGYAIVFLTFGVLGGWAAVAKLDSAVVAPATIALQGNRKVVEHLEGGIVHGISVDEADRVNKGDVLITLSDIEARSNLNVTQTRLDMAQITEARLVAERGIKDSFDVPETMLEHEDNPSVQEVLADQKDTFRERRSIMKSRIDILKSRIEQTTEQIKGLEIRKDALNRRVENFTTMVERMRRGSESGLVRGNILSEREDELIQIESSYGESISEIAQARNVINETEFEILQVKQEYRQRASDELDETRSEIAELRQREKVALNVLERTKIRAPGSGSVQNLKVHTVGSVIRPGDVLMELVPENEELVVNARVAPQDIDNVVSGLETEIRFTAFSTRMTPLMLGVVESVSEDIITPDNNQDPPYYLARIGVEEVDIPEDIRDRLSAGMPADVVIKLGERTVANFLVAPLMDAIRKSMVEE